MGLLNPSLPLEGLTDDLGLNGSEAPLCHVAILLPSGTTVHHTFSFQASANNYGITLDQQTRSMFLETDVFMTRSD